MTDDKQIAPDANERGTTRRRRALAAALAVPLAAGAVGAAGWSLARPGPVQITPVAPVAIGQLAPSGATAVKGRVAEIYGNKFVVQDDTGRALVETGRAGETGTLVKTGDTVTVQGRFETGFLHASVMTREDGSRTLLGPAAGPPRPSLDGARERLGLAAGPDVPALTAAVEAAGYSDVRVTGRGPRHLEVAARAADGRDASLHVGFDGQVRPAPARPAPGRPDPARPDPARPDPARP